MIHRPFFISILSEGGLCNRMRTMAGIIKLAKIWNARVVFIWISMPDMNAAFNSLFVNFPYKVIDLQGRGRSFKIKQIIKETCSICGWEQIDDKIVYQFFKGKDRGAQYLKGIENKNLYVETCENITDSNDFSMFQIKTELLYAKNFKIDQNTIGVHMRRTDNIPSVINSPTDLFVQEMKDEIANNPKCTFYLATDDKNEETCLQKEFSERIMVYNKRSLDRNNPIGIEDALIDLYNLSQCHHILGSYSSSFSDVAAFWGNIEKRVVKKL